MTARSVRAAAAAAFVLLITPPARHALEGSMVLHMFVQLPLFVACGAVLATSMPERMREAIGRWNSHGVAGLFAFALVTALLMIPRLLDLAVANAAIDVAKAFALAACGALLRLSWARAGLLVQAFFLGNVLPMTVAVGQAYIDSPLRLCNAYLLGDQVRVGHALVASAAAIALAWLARATVLLVRREREAEEAPAAL